MKRFVLYLFFLSYFGNALAQDRNFNTEKLGALDAFILDRSFIRSEKKKSSSSLARKESFEFIFVKNTSNFKLKLFSKAEAHLMKLCQSLYHVVTQKLTGLQCSMFKA